MSEPRVLRGSDAMELMLDIRLDGIMTGYASAILHLLGYRPMNPDWARSLRDQCVSAGIPFHFKQWGEWVTEGQSPEDAVIPGRIRYYEWPVGPDSLRLGKRCAGRELDGRTWDEYPGGLTDA